MACKYVFMVVKTEHSPHIGRHSVGCPVCGGLVYRYSASLNTLCGLAGMLSFPSRNLVLLIPYERLCRGRFDPPFRLLPSILFPVLVARFGPIS